MFADGTSQNASGRDMQILTVCPLCHASYNPLKTQIVAERDDAHLLYLECRQCGSSVVAVVTTGVSGLTTIGVVTDLSSHELATWQDKDEIGHDDAIDLYRWIEYTERQFIALETTRH